MKHWRWAAVMAAVAAAGVGAWMHRSSKEDNDSFVKEARVARGDVELTILSTGDVRPRNRLEIKPPIPGRAEDILVREGDSVRKGQVVAWMSSTERAALLDAARAQGADVLTTWEDLYKPTPLVAPLTGLIIARNVEPGQTITAADPVLVMSDKLILKAQVDETDMARVRLGQTVTIALDAFPRSSFTGAVEHIAFEAKTVSNVTVYEVDVLPQDPPAFMRSGMTANMTFLVDRRTGVLWLPTAAIRNDGDDPTVLIPGPKRTRVSKPVTVGVSNGKKTEILSGLDEGDAVIVDDGLPTVEAKVKTSPLSPVMRRPGRRVR